MLTWLLGLPREGTPIGGDGFPRPCVPRDGGKGSVTLEPKRHLYLCWDGWTPRAPAVPPVVRQRPDYSDSLER